MPSENKTPHYGLNQWQGNEYPKRADFNEDNDLIDAALTAHTTDTIAHMTQAQKNQLANALPSDGTAADAKRVQTQSHPDHHLRTVWDGVDRFDLGAESPDGTQLSVRVQDAKWSWSTGNTASVAGAMTVSTAEPSSFIGAGKLWGVY
nr:MAG TPA: hypothetical protein [Caudoviricetes sp.]